jgi:hypothetical protein
VAKRDASGDLIVQRTADSAPPSTAWLTSLSEGDVLTYAVEGDTISPSPVRFRVERLVRRRNAVAALLTPQQPPALDPVPASHWLAGDDEGLYRLANDQPLLDPGLTPIDTDGRVIREARSMAVWRVPRG